MAQHDLDIANASGAAVRNDLNNALAALGSSMKGPNAPPAPLAGMIWVDDDTPSATVWTVKQYDGAEWIELGRLDITNNIYIPSEGVIAWADVASAATVDLGAQASRSLRITGTTTITSFGTAASGVRKRLRIATGLTITHNATSLICPGAANLVLGAGDILDVESLGSGNWVVTDYTQAIGPSWQLCEAPRVVSGVASLDFTLPAIFRRYRLTLQDGVVNTSGQNLLLRFSSDGGATFLTAASYQQIGNVTDFSAANTPFASSANASIALSAGLPASSGNPLDATFEINPGSATLSARVRGNAIGVSSTPAWLHGYYGGAWLGAGARMNAIRILVGSGNLSGTFILEGMR
jgi:hypothetical protein